MKSLFGTWLTFMATLLCLLLFSLSDTLGTDRSGIVRKVAEKPLPASDQMKTNADINIYPNPFKDHFTIAFEPFAPIAEYDVKIYDLIGMELIAVQLLEKSAHNAYIVKTDNLGSGVYFCNFYINGKLVAVRKITCIK